MQKTDQNLTDSLESQAQYFSLILRCRKSPEGEISGEIIEVSNNKASPFRNIQQLFHFIEQKLSEKGETP